MMVVTVCDARVAAGADQQRDEEGQRHHRRHLALEVSQHGAGERLGHEQQQQPADPLAHHAPERVVEVGLVERARLDAGHAQDVLRALLDQDVDDVVDGHEARPRCRPSPARAPPAGCTSRSCAATASWSSSASTVTGLRRITSAMRLLQLGHHQVAQRHRAEQLRRCPAPARSRRRSTPSRAPPTGCASGRRPRVMAGVEADELGGHDAARGVVGVLAAAARPRRAPRP